MTNNGQLFSAGSNKVGQLGIGNDEEVEEDEEEKQNNK
jgi:alpha-tubulin suppressor-like RCC1 family protein